MCGYGYSKKITINSLEGNYKDAYVKSSLKLDFSPKKNAQQEEELPFDLNLELNGKIEHLVEILRSEEFLFSKANYKLNVGFKGAANNLSEFINQSNITLAVDKGVLFYKSLGLKIPFNTLNVALLNGNTRVQNFIINLPFSQNINIEGSISNFAHIFNHNISKKDVYSNIKISSKNVDFSNFIDFFNTHNKTHSHLQINTPQNNIKYILKDIYQKYHPNLTIELGNLSYRNVNLENLNASLCFINKNQLNFTDVFFDYYNKRISLEATLNIEDETLSPFTTQLEIKDVPIEHLLETFSNFEFSQLNSPTEITGNIYAKTDIKGVIDDHKGIKEETLEAYLDYNIKELRIKNFTPIIDAGNILFRKQRFQDIKFADIQSELFIKNKILTLPQTNVQSTAFQFFIEGVIDNKNNTDVWVSIPLSNFKRRDLAQPPPKKLFEETGSKIYMEVKANKDGKLKNKLHFSNKKLREKKEKILKDQTKSNP